MGNPFTKGAPSPSILEPLGNLFDFSPYLNDNSHFMPPGSDAQFVDRGALDWLAALTHIPLCVNNGNEEESPPGATQLLTSTSSVNSV
jgi:hypothetical protein